MEIRNAIINLTRRTNSKVLILFISFFTFGSINYRYRILQKVYNDYIYSTTSQKRIYIFELCCRY